MVALGGGLPLTLRTSPHESTCKGFVQSPFLLPLSSSQPPPTALPSLCPPSPRHPPSTGLSEQQREGKNLQQQECDTDEQSLWGFFPTFSCCSNCGKCVPGKETEDHLAPPPPLLSCELSSSLPPFVSASFISLLSLSLVISSKPYLPLSPFSPSFIVLLLGSVEVACGATLHKEVNLKQVQNKSHLRPH